MSTSAAASRQTGIQRANHFLPSDCFDWLHFAKTTKINCTAITWNKNVEKERKKQLRTKNERSRFARFVRFEKRKTKNKMPTNTIPTMTMLWDGFFSPGIRQFQKSKKKYALQEYRKRQWKRKWWKKFSRAEHIKYIVGTCQTKLSYWLSMFVCEWAFVWINAIEY